MEVVQTDNYGALAMHGIMRTDRYCEVLTSKITSTQFG